MMNKDILQGNWKQLKGEGLKVWGKITGDEWDVLEGNRQKLIGHLQERYGWAEEEAEQRVREQEQKWEKSLRH